MHRRDLPTGRAGTKGHHLAGRKDRLVADDRTDGAPPIRRAAVPKISSGRAAGDRRRTTMHPVQAVPVSPGTAIKSGGTGRARLLEWRAGVGLTSRVAPRHADVPSISRPHPEERSTSPAAQPARSGRVVSAAAVPDPALSLRATPVCRGWRGDHWETGRDRPGPAASIRCRTSSRPATATLRRRCNHDSVCRHNKRFPPGSPPGANRQELARVRPAWE